MSLQSYACSTQTISQAAFKQASMSLQKCQAANLYCIWTPTYLPMDVLTGCLRMTAAQGHFSDVLQQRQQIDL